MIALLTALVVGGFVSSVQQETAERRFRVSELTPVGQRVGWAREPPPDVIERANFYVVFPSTESNTEKLLFINEYTGEIRIQAPLDHELEKELVVLIIPIDGSPSIKVVVEVEDANDNSPTFSTSSVQLEISEQARIDTELPLPLASDPDSTLFNVQKYRIASGNVNNAFRLTTKSLNNQLYADLIVNGNLDREYRDRYNLLIEAIDGGNPPKIGQLEAQIHILDANDNAPEFDHSRYAVQVPFNASLGHQIIQVVAHDADDGENARITYSITHANYEEVYYYQIDDSTGRISVAIAPLPAGTVHELLVTARDNGFQPLESSVFLTVQVLDEFNDDNSIDGLQITWLTDNGQPLLAENLTIGFLVARLELGSQYVMDGIKLTVDGCPLLCLKETDSPSIYLLIACGLFDREAQANYRLMFTLTDANNQQIFQHPVYVEIEDLNDNAPEWSQSLYRIAFNRSYDDEIGQRTVAKLIAHDRDVGENARIRYTLYGTDLFQVNSETGVLSTNELLNCSIGPEVKFRILAEDNGHPRLSSAANVQIDLINADAQPPLFEKSLYEVTVREDADVSTCLVQVRASNRGCGVTDSSQIRYSLQVSKNEDEQHLTKVFRLDAVTGKLCLGDRLDFERRTRYQLTVLGNGQNSRTSSALVDIHIEDVNDHAPQFQPNEYHLIVREGQRYDNSLLTLFAYDEDRGNFGRLQYFIEETSNDAAKFRLDQESETGQLYLNEPFQGLKDESTIELKVNARDGGSMTSLVPATVYVHIQNTSTEPCLTFVNSPYVFSTTEDILPGIIVGTVKTQPMSPKRHLQIVSGNQHNKFRLDSQSGRLLITNELDADHQNVYWLTIKATLKLSDENDECVNYTQIKVHINDINDNAPRFDMSFVETNILENYPIHEPFFAVQAIDRDRNENGRVTYELVSSDPPCPVIVRPLSGQLLLAAPLDYEQMQQYRLLIRAQDQGVPPRSATINVTLNIHDVNDNAPEFSKVVYDAEIPEDAPLMSNVLKVLARDRDSDANSFVHYHIAANSMSNDFNVNTMTGEVFVKRALDRERQAEYRFLVVATDQGTPSLTSNSTIIVRLSDVNDNTPNCSTIQRFLLNEQQNNHRQLVGILRAIDEDAGINGTVVYRMQKHNELFDLKSTGELYLRRKIQQLKDSYRLSVIAEDQGLQPRSVVCQVLVKVERSPSEIVIQEPVERLIHFDPACGVGCPLVRLNASNVKRWSLEKDEKFSQFFQIDNDGLLRLAKRINSIDHDGMKEVFKKPEPLIVNLFDAYEQQKQLTLSMKRTIRLVDNSSSLVRVSERASPGARLTSALSKSAMDNDTNAFYALSEESETFEVDSATSALYLRARLNYSNNPLQTLKLTKYSLQGVALNETAVLVDIQHENMNAPRFESALVKLSISEATSIGTVLAQIEAFDLDEGPNGTLTYRIQGDNHLFGVDEASGEITLKQKLQFHMQSKHFFVLEAIDQPSNPSERRRTACIVQIQVIDSNDNSPIFLSPSSMTLLADLLPSNHPVHYFVASDADTGDSGRVQYKIVNGNGHPPAFLVDSQTGALTVLHRPVSPLVQLTIRALDTDPVMPKFTEQLFTINVHEDETKWSYFAQTIYDFTLLANTQINTLLIDFKRPAFEVTAQPTFKLLPQTITDFELHPQRGILKTTTDLLKCGTYRMTVYASDPLQKLSDLATVVVHVPEHKSVGPKFAAATCSEVWARENEPVSQVTRVVATINNDESAEIVYQIEGGSGIDLFSIDPKTGIISAKPLDREQVAEHVLVVSASDTSVPRKVDVCTVKIRVQDVNDSPPEFASLSPNRLTITDEQQIGMVVAKFKATDKDADANGQIVYKLINDESGVFDINAESGELFLARDLPFLASSWEIIVVAEDMGLNRVLHAEKRVQVEWQRQKPRIDSWKKLEFLHQNQTVVVAEGQSKGKFVLQIETTAKFLPDSKVVFKILSGNTGNAFELDELGVLKTARELDAETQLKYALKIQASMSGNRHAWDYVIVWVLNTNDNAPLFPHPLVRRVEEDTPVGSLITNVVAHDVDVGAFNSVEYALTMPNDYFELQRATGDLILLKQLDYETTTEHVLSIQAFDGEFSTFSSIKIIIIDINDNAPVFTSDLFEFSAPPALRLPAEIGQVQALDNDFGELGRISYKLLDADSGLKLDSKTGIVTLTRAIKENEEKFVTVQAVDHGSPPLNAISTIKISSVARLAKDMPQFASQNYSFMVTEDFPLYLPFGHLIVKNATASQIACRFHIEEADVARHFHIDADGRISLKLPLDFEQQQVYKTRVAVRNVFASSSTVSTHVALLTVQVVDVNDNEPQFTKETRKLVIRVNERMKRGTRVALLTAEDADSAENSRLSYAMVPSGEDLLWNVFHIHPGSGAIHFERWHDELVLQADSQQLNSTNMTEVKHRFVVSVTDNGFPQPKWSFAEVSVLFDIESWSGTAPFFPLPAYRRSVLENVPNKTKLLRVRATNKLGQESNNWTYKLINNDEIFKVNPRTGEIFVDGELDYEKRVDYEFSITVTDQRQRSAVAPVFINIVGVDEFAPVFAKPAYIFQMPWSIKPGQHIGRVHASDQDTGHYGHVTYTIQQEPNKTSQQSLIGIDPQSGIMVLRSVPTSNKLNRTETIELTVVASSSTVQFARVNVLIEFNEDAKIFTYDQASGMESASRLTKMFIIGLIFLFLIISLLLFGFCIRFCSQRRRREPKSRKQIYSVARGNIAVMTNVERLSPTYINKSASHFSSPTTAVATSLVSSGISASSPSEDGGHQMQVQPNHTGENVRMRNEVAMAMSRSQPDSGIDADALSVGSLSDYLNQMSARSAAAFSKSSTFNDTAITELLNTSATQDSFRVPSSQASLSGVYDFPLRSTVKPLQLKRNSNFSYIATTHTFTDPSVATGVDQQNLLQNNAQP